jgi:hypothetical protein
MAYSEDLPKAGFTGSSAGKYVRRHAPWVNWQGTGPNGLSPAIHQPMTAFPADYAKLAQVVFVVPNLGNDMHDGTVAQGDAWLKAKLDGYVKWAKTHNSLFILTFDEDEGGGLANRIPTLMAGAMVKPGKYAKRITHYEMLRTLEDMFDATHSGAAATAKPITEAWIAPVGLATGSAVGLQDRWTWSGGWLGPAAGGNRRLEYACAGSDYFFFFLMNNPRLFTKSLRVSSLKSLNSPASK